MALIGQEPGGDAALPAVGLPVVGAPSVGLVVALVPAGLVGTRNLPPRWLALLLLLLQLSLLLPQLLLLHQLLLLQLARPVFGSDVEHVGERHVGREAARRGYGSFLVPVDASHSAGPPSTRGGVDEAVLRVGQLETGLDLLLGPRGAGVGDGQHMELFHSDVFVEGCVLRIPPGREGKVRIDVLGAGAVLEEECDSRHLGALGQLD